MCWLRGGEAALCVRKDRKLEAGTLPAPACAKFLSFLAVQESTIPTGSLKTPGEKPRFHGVELLEIFLNSWIRKQSKENVDFHAVG